MNSIAEDKDLRFLKDYSSFLLNNKLEEAVCENLRLVEAFQLPLLKVLSHLSKEELTLLTKNSLAKFFEDIIEGRLIETTKQTVQKWQADQLEGVKKNSIGAFDIIYSHTARKLLFLHFLPGYTTDIVIAANVMKELEILYAEVQSLLINTYSVVQHQELTKQKDFSDLLIKSSIDGIVSYDRQGKITVWNNAMENICDIKAEDAIGKSLMNIYDTFLNEEEAEAFKLVLEGKRTTLKNQEYRIREGFYNIDIIPIEYEGVIVGGVNFIQDISESKEKEAILKQYQDELQATNEELQENKEELIASNEELTESHHTLFSSLQQINKQYDELLELQVELRRSEKRYRLLALNSTDIITAYDEEGNYSYVSETVKNVLGIPAEELIGTSPLDLIHPDDMEVVLKASEKLQTTGETQRFEYRLQNVDKEYLWMETIARVVIDPDKPEKIEVQASTRDIQARKEAEIALEEERDQQLKLVINALPALIAYVDNKSRYKFVNIAYKDWFGKDPEELIGQDARSFVSESQRLDIYENHRRVLSGEKFETEIKLTDKEGLQRTVEIRYIPHISDDNEVLGFVVLTMDMTDRIKVRDELSAKNIELQQINIDLDNFIYTASHDLKAPILNLEGLFLALNKRFGDKFGDKEQMIVKMIYDSIAKFKDTIKNLTEITKVNKDIDSQASLLSFRQVIDDVILDIRPDIEVANPDIIVNLEEEQIYFAPHNLRSIVYNLISNAIKYKSPDRKPKVWISTYNEGDYTILKVQDNGLGMSEYQLPKLFTMFKRLHSHVEGTGIGLYIVKRIITNSGGRIEVDSKQDIGTTFRVYLKKNRP